MSLADWLIVGGAAVYFGICGFVLLFWRSDPSEVDQQRADLVEKIAERLP